MYFSDLCAQYAFDNFIVGSANKEAYSAAFSMANGGSVSFYPLIICGWEGLGKTHLLHAIGNDVVSKDKAKKVIAP